MADYKQLPVKADTEKEVKQLRRELSAQYERDITLDETVAELLDAYDE